MRKPSIFILVILAFTLTCNRVQAQVLEPNVQSLSSNQTAPRDNLDQLIENVFLAFKLYQTGESKVYDHEKNMPPVLVFNKEKSELHLDREELKYIPIGMVESIEASYDLGKNCIYGARGAICVVRIVLKDNWKQAYKTKKETLSLEY